MNNSSYTRRPWSIVCGLLSIILLGAILRFHGLFANSFHADEALFASWARLIAVWRDPLLLTQAVDKPPLPFYLQAVFYPLLGPVEWAARMPAFIASLLLIPLAAQLARRLTGDRVAALPAALFVAVAPLAVQFSATAFTDPLLAFWLAAALYAVAAPRESGNPPRFAGLLTGILFGLALATKYQALLFVPLLVGLGWVRGRTSGEWLRGLAGFALVVVALLAWQLARPATADVVALQWANIGGIRPAYSWDLWPRVLATARLWGLGMGLSLVALSVVLVIGLLLNKHGRICLSPIESLLILYILGYTLLHCLWAVPVWDRYLLPVMPLVAVLFGRAVSAILSAAGRRQDLRRGFALAVLAALLLLMPVASSARAGGFPIGGQPAADGGARHVAQLLKDAPYGTVLYDHWYSWHWQYQLFDGRVYVSWFPHADALLDDLAVFAGGGSPRYLVLPASTTGDPIARQLMESGYALERVGDQDATADMRLYRIVGRETGQ